LKAAETQKYEDSDSTQEALINKEYLWKLLVDERNVLDEDKDLGR